MKVITRDNRPRPVLVTPARGSDGDKTFQGDEAQTRISAILARYGGNLAEMVAWRGPLNYGDQSMTTDMVDALNVLKDAREAYDALGANNPFASFEEAMAAVADGTVAEKFAAMNAAKKEETPKKEETHEEKKD